MVTNALPTEPYQIYLDSSVIIDLVVTTNPRHVTATQLLTWFQQHKRNNAVKVITSPWALAEVKGVVYGKLLEQQGYIAPPNMNIRNLMPPVATELIAAKQLVDNAVALLETTTNFQLWLPTTISQTTQFWSLVTELGQEMAIWPNDSIHLASALQSMCSMFISDDRDFLDKIDFSVNTFINNYRQAEFPLIYATLPAFNCKGLRSYICRAPGLNGIRRSTAITELRRMRL